MSLTSRFERWRNTVVLVYLIYMRNPFSFLIRGFQRESVEALDHGSLIIHKIDDELTDNMRALRLVATLCDQLLSRGMPASDAVYLGLEVTSAYCSRKVHIDISHTILTISQDRGIDREPLTLVRTVASRGSDYHTLQLLEDLARSAGKEEVSLDDAERQLDDIISRKRIYPPIVIHLAGGGISAGVVMLYSHNPFMWLIALLMGTMISLVIGRMTKMGLPSFYIQSLSGLIIILIAAATSLLAMTTVPFLAEVNPTLVIISGIVMLVAGMMIASAFQDALDEYYVTAMARLLKVIMMTGGIVIGTTVGLYIATRLGVHLAATPNHLSLADINYQYAGAAVLAASFALGNYARPIAIISAGLVGFLSLYVTLVLMSFDLGQIAASGVAAMVVGIAASLLSRLLKIPTIAIMSAGIIPLVPGLTLYSALHYISQSAPNTSDFDTGVAFLMRALLIAVVVAAGVTFGALMGRPARKRHAHLANRLPHRHLGRRRTAR